MILHGVFQPQETTQAPLSPWDQPVLQPTKRPATEPSQVQQTKAQCREGRAELSRAGSNLILLELSLAISLYSKSVEPRRACSSNIKLARKCNRIQIFRFMVFVRFIATTQCNAKLNNVNSGGIIIGKSHTTTSGSQ